MAIDIKFDSIGNPEPPTIVLANRNGNKLGQLDVNTDSIEIIDKFNNASEFAFTLNKYANGKITNLWDRVVDFKLVYCKEWDMWFEITVELDEDTETIKTVTCTQLGQAELSQIMLYNIEINTEKDIERDDYKISILYDEDNPKSSMLHRILEKAPHYSIAYVDPTIQRIQRQFSFDGTSICDAFDEIGEEIGCLFVYDSNSDAEGMPNRTISVYDLQQNCRDCNHRGEFIDECPKCGSKNIKYGYGEDTLIFVTSDELATEGIQLVTDTDSVKNCFKLEAGDDLMTATIRNCNPNGSDYIWYFSDAVKEDMSKELVEKIESYDELYKDYCNNYQSELNENLVDKYNGLVEKYKKYYNTPSTCLNCDYEGYFDNKCPECGNENILIGKSLQSISTPITGYSNLMNAYYNTIDLALYLKSSLMPSIEMSKTSAEEQAALLTTSALSPVAVNVDKIDNVSLATADSAVLSMAKIVVKSTYKVEIKNSTLSDNNIWNGQFVVTNYSDENDTADSNTINVVINNNTETFIKQKIEKALNKENTDDLSISGLFSEENYSYDEFCAELKKYALNPLKSFYDACDACLNILIDQDAGDKNQKPDLYESLYEPYYNKSLAIAKEIKIREDEIAIIEGVYDRTDESNSVLITEGLQTNIEKCKNNIQKKLDFEGYLGKDLWLEFCSYRREDKYSNDNYISDGLNNAELFKKSLEFIEVAENEIFKSAELQHSISTTLNNLLAIPKFKSLVKSFKTGNWIRVRVDEKIYKLRLLEYDINYGDFDNIPVEFSDVVKIKNGITDVESVLSQASSMASSYDSVQKQAQKGNVARGTIDQWLMDGLDTSNVRIQNNNSEEIVITKNGLLARSYSDITGTYLPEQFKLTHNIMAYTTDNWKTVSAALGKHEYTKWENNQWIKDIDYGLSSKFVTAGYITGSQFIGGEIVSSNYKVGEDAKGTYLNLIEGDFDFAGGKIIYNANDNEVLLSGVTIKWDSVNPPSIANVDGLSDEIKMIDTIANGLKFTEISGQSVISPNIIGGSITGGYLNIINTNNNSRVIIDPNNLTKNDYIFQVHNGDKVTVGIDKDGNAVFEGKIYTEAGGTIGGFDIGEKSIYNVKTSYNDANNGVYIGTDGIGLGKGKFWVNDKGYLHATNAYLDGQIFSEEGVIGGFTIDSDCIYHTKTAYDDEEDGVYIGTDGIGLGKGTFYVTNEGYLNATLANIGGHIEATSGNFTNCTIDKDCTIAGWTIDNHLIHRDGVVGLCSYDSNGDSDSIYVKPSLKDGSPSDVRFFAGASDIVDVANSNFAVLADGSLYANAAKIDGNSQIGNLLISNGGLTCSEDTVDTYFRYINTVDITPTSFSVTHEIADATYEYKNVLVGNSATIANGIFNRTIYGNELVNATNLSCMEITFGDTTYVIYIDITDMTVKVKIK